MNLFIIVLLLLLNGCSWQHESGDRFEIYTNAELFAPSGTVYVDKKTDKVYVIGGQSVTSQLQGPATAAVLGPFLPDGDNYSVTNSSTSASQAPNNLKNFNWNSNTNGNFNQLGGYH